MIRGIDLLFLVPYVLVPVLGFVLALVSRRWLSLIPPVALNVVFWIGLDNEWWGYGTGDGWPILVILTTFMAIGAAGLGLLWHRAVRARKNRGLGEA